jgi:exoribonuclease R
MMGAGEYVVELAGGSAAGHFGLAVRDYAHSTAPNRRYPDLITRRLLKAAMEGRSLPYENDELDRLAKHCIEEEDAAKKVERQVGEIRGSNAAGIKNRGALRCHRHRRI